MKRRKRKADQEMITLLRDELVRQANDIHDLHEQRKEGNQALKECRKALKEASVFGTYLPYLLWLEKHKTAIDATKNVDDEGEDEWEL